MLQFTREDFAKNSQQIIEFTLAGQVVVIDCGEQDIYLIPAGLGEEDW